MTENQYGFLLPWHQPDWERMQAALRMKRLPHALLLSGAGGLGKRAFAELLAASLFCRSPHTSGEPCGKCKGCHLYNAGTHPDFRCIQPEEPGKAIKIDTIRDFTSREGLTAQAGGFKVVIIEPAEAMNRAAANSLLKTLEEPVAWTLIILITSSPTRLPPTIRSRCQQLNMQTPDKTLALGWLGRQLESESEPELLLDLASGAPLRALALASPEILELRVKLFGQFAAILQGENDPVIVAADWGKLDPLQVVDWYCGWLIDCLRLRADPSFRSLLNPDQRNHLQRIGNQIESRRLFWLLDQAFEALSGLRAQLNQQMVMEELLLSLVGNGNFRR